MSLRLIKFPLFLGGITLGKHLWCCVLPRAVWTWLPLLSDSQGLCGLQDSTATLKVNKKRSSDFPTATICPGSKTSPATAAHNTHLYSTVWWLQQPRLSGTIPTLTSSASVPPVTLAKQTSTSRRRQTRAWVRNGSWSTLTVYSIFLNPLSISFHLTLMQQTQLPGPIDLSHLPLFINPPFSSPSLTSTGQSSHLSDQRLALVRPKALKYISAMNNFQELPHLSLCHSRAVQGRGLQAFHTECQSPLF